MQFKYPSNCLSFVSIEVEKMPQCVRNTERERRQVQLSILFTLRTMHKFPRKLKSTLYIPMVTRPEISHIVVAPDLSPAQVKCAINAPTLPTGDHCKDHESFTGQTTNNYLHTWTGYNKELFTRTLQFKLILYRL